MIECSGNLCHHIFQPPNYSGIFETLHKILEKIFNLDRNEEIMQMRMNFGYFGLLLLGSLQLIILKL